jgi:hypothetical protein
MRDRQQVEGTGIYRLFVSHLEKSAGVTFSDEFRGATLASSTSAAGVVLNEQGSSSGLVAFKVTEDALDPVLPRQ